MIKFSFLFFVPGLYSPIFSAWEGVVTFQFE